MERQGVHRSNAAIRFVIRTENIHDSGGCPEWHMCQKGVSHIHHYLDDIVVLEAPPDLSCIRSVGCWVCQ